jgi:transcriptional regulator with XRE-family HTH domain
MPSKRTKDHGKHKRIGDVLKAARLALGLSQADLANRLGYSSPQFVSDWERGYSSLPMKMLVRIAQELNLDRDKLFELLLDFSVERLRQNMLNEYSKIDKPSKLRVTKKR